MNFIIGDADSANKLARELGKRMKEIVTETKDMENDLKQLEQSFQDSGIDSVKIVISQVEKELVQHVDDVLQLCSSLQAYAEVLRKI